MSVIRILLSSIALHLAALSTLAVVTKNLVQTDEIYLTDVTISQAIVRKHTTKKNLVPKIESGVTQELSSNVENPSGELVSKLRLQIQQLLEQHINRTARGEITVVMAFDSRGATNLVEVLKSSGNPQFDSNVVEVLSTLTTSESLLANRRIQIPIRLL